MRQTFNVLFFIRQTRALKSGENPIMLRISIAGQLSEIQLKRAVKPNLWNQNKERCTGKDAASLEITRYLESVKLPFNRHWINKFTFFLHLAVNFKRSGIRKTPFV